MRIVGGLLKGKKIFDPLDKSTRPLKDLVRESIFNILEHSKNEYVELKKAKVLDLFSGTGSFGIECLSRGAEKVFFFENYSKSLEILKKNIYNLDLLDKSSIFEESAYDLDHIKKIHNDFDLIFLDPPFRDSKINQLISTIKKIKLANKNTLIIMHRNKKLKEILSKNLNILREKNYGLSKIIFAKII
tara:strand:+ start:1248 stop:1811 length:564 start_codon:yes stop_codon:yes gene_type:complete